jgi:hypothetical protein
LSRQHPPEALRNHLFGALVGEHYDIEATEAFGVVTVAFPNLTLQPIASHRPTRDATRDSETKSGLVHAVGTHDDCNDLRAQPNTAGEDLCEIFPSPQPLLRPEPSIGGFALRQRVCFVPSHVGR